MKVSDRERSHNFVQMCAFYNHFYNWKYTDTDHIVWDTWGQWRRLQQSQRGLHRPHPWPWHRWGNIRTRPVCSSQSHSMLGSDMELAHRSRTRPGSYTHWIMWVKPLNIICNLNIFQFYPVARRRNNLIMMSNALEEGQEETENMYDVAPLINLHWFCLD